MTQSLRAFLIITLLMVPLAPQAQAQEQETPEPAAQQSTKVTPIAVQLKKTVVFLRVIFLKGGAVQESRGTGFFLHFEDSRLPKGRAFSYLVTNRHMVEPLDEEGQVLRVLRIFVRLNLRNPTGENQSEEGQLPPVKWFFHQSEAVDLAVAILVPDLERYDLMAVPSSMLATKDKLESDNIAEGDKVTYAGYFAQYPGTKKIQPVVREGVIAMMPDEEVPTALDKPGYVYMADVHVFGGNSGSPMLVGVGGVRQGRFTTGDKSYLLGVVSGYYTEEHDFKLRAATVVSGRAKSNNGITIVVPAYQLLELLEEPELKAMRDRGVELENAKNAPK